MTTATYGGSAIIKTLETAWRAIQRQVPELPDVVIVTGSGQETARGTKWGHTWADRWVLSSPKNIDSEGGTVRAETGKVTELFIAGERLACGGRLTLQTLLHEATHILAHVRGIKDTSRQAKYHNQRFVALAEELGLYYPKTKPHTVIGWSAVVLTEQSLTRHKSTINRLDHAIGAFLELPPGVTPGGDDGDGDGGGESIPRPRRTGPNGGGRETGPSTAICKCRDPKRIRVAPKVLARGKGIKCCDCNERFVIVSGRGAPNVEKD